MNTSSRSALLQSLIIPFTDVMWSSVNKPDCLIACQDWMEKPPSSQRGEQAVCDTPCPIRLEEVAVGTTYGLLCVDMLPTRYSASTLVIGIHLLFHFKDMLGTLFPDHQLKCKPLEPFIIALLYDGLHRPYVSQGSSWQC